jgi:hypothetical protein
MPRASGYRVNRWLPVRAPGPRRVSQAILAVAAGLALFLRGSVVEIFESSVARCCPVSTRATASGANKAATVCECRGAARVSRLPARGDVIVFAKDTLDRPAHLVSASLDSPGTDLQVEGAPQHLMVGRCQATRACTPTWHPASTSGRLRSVLGMPSISLSHASVSAFSELCVKPGECSFWATTRQQPIQGVERRPWWSLPMSHRRCAQWVWSAWGERENGLARDPSRSVAC